MRLLHISASPRGERSESLALAEVFLEAFTQVRPEADVDHFDLWDGSLPAFGPAAAAAKMAVFVGADPQGREAEAWTRATATFDRFAAADAYLFSVPMWNAGVPYILKQFIDVVSQPGMLFTFDPVTGYTGLLTGRRAAVIYTGAVYGPGRGPAFGSDFQTTF
ncbi:MAG TPA: NAD(P)H-dependent oxidoreductase, partial [Microlunatus sp.]|nr:NAD(P)H-dependent oxidoreductase [Microlunatus sp.]